VGWLVYGALVWMALVVFFWCLLLVAARADRRDAGVSLREPQGAVGRADPRTTGHFARARHESQRHVLAGLARARHEPDERLVQHREHEP
jgi:hypothetical protein